jgi:hypothetical protein
MARGALGFVAILLAAACGCASSGGGGGGGSASGASSGYGNGQLLQKAMALEDVITARHVPDGMVVDRAIDPATGQATDFQQVENSQIWTGIYIGAEALRYRVTFDPAALASMERSLWALHDAQAMTGDPGYIPRGFAHAADYPRGVTGVGQYAAYKYDDDNVSRDQYVGAMFGYGLSFDVIQDPALRAAVQQDVRQVVDRLMANDMALIMTRNAQPVVMYSLDPCYGYQDKLTAQTWASMSTFPLNLITQAIPYDPALAQAIESVKLPPLRGGEALHALAFVRTAAHVTGDPKYDAYYRNVLVSQLGYLDAVTETSMMIDDILHGQSMDVLEALLVQFADNISAALDQYLAQKIGPLSIVAGAVIQAALEPIFHSVGAAIKDAVRAIRNPATPGNAAITTTSLLALSQVMDMLGETQTAHALGLLAGNANALASSNLDDCANTMRSYTGEDLFHLSLYNVMFQETDPYFRSVYAAVLERKEAYVGGELNAWFNYMGGAYETSGPVPQRIADAKGSLALHPTDMMDHVCDNSNMPGLRVSPWPDRFGQWGNVAIDVFPLDRRSPNHDIWHYPCREIRTGGSGPTEMAPFGYVAAYWMGRWHGFLTAQD